MRVIVEQNTRIKALEDQLSKHSGNSSQPPSQDVFGPFKARSLPKSSGKSPSGQPGHPGKGGQLKGDADHTFDHHVAACPACGVDLSTTPADYVIRKQIEDLSPIKTFIEEHRIQVKICPCCQQQWQAQGCPAHVQHHFAYGPRVKALAVYLSTFQGAAPRFIPAQRTKQLMATLGIELSTGSLGNFRQAAGRELGAFQDALRKGVVASAAAFFDETGVKVKGIRYWVHVACTAMFSVFMLHPKRGRKAHQDMAVLDDFQGVLHRDDYPSYRTMSRLRIVYAALICYANLTTLLNVMFF